MLGHAIKGRRKIKHVSSNKYQICEIKFNYTAVTSLAQEYFEPKLSVMFKGYYNRLL